MNLCECLKKLKNLKKIDLVLLQNDLWENEENFMTLG